MFELAVEYRECLVFLLIYKIFKRGFLHDSKHADNQEKYVISLKIVPKKWSLNHDSNLTLCPSYCYMSAMPDGMFAHSIPTFPPTA